MSITFELEVCFVNRLDVEQTMNYCSHTEDLRFWIFFF